MLIQQTATAAKGSRGGSSRSWFLALGAGWLPAMGIGFTFSALADRLIFVGWGLAAATVYSWALRHGFEVGTPVTFGLLGAAASLLVLAWLVARHQGSLDLGYRAFLPGLYHPWISRPGAIYGLGIACGLGAALASTQPWKWRTSR